MAGNSKERALPRHCHFKALAHSARPGYFKQFAIGSRPIDHALLGCATNPLNHQLICGLFLAALETC